jgi:HlyD family type I secretion membrane fusion protein
VNEFWPPTELARRATVMWHDFRAWLETENGQAAGLFVFAVTCLYVILRIVNRRRNRTPRERSLARETRGPKVIGYAVAILFFGGFGTWSAVASLSGATMAPGIVSPDGSRKTIQHLEGGIVKTIHVREGDSVRSGEPLVTLQDTRALAQYEELRERQVFLTALEARLLAEQLGVDRIDFPEELFQEASLTSKSAIESQRALFESREEVQAVRERILQQRIAQLDEEIAGLVEVIAAQDEQLDLVAQELEATQQLYEKGLTPLPKVLAIRRSSAQIRGEKATNRAAIARNRQAIGETEIQLIATRQQRQEAASDELTNVRAELAGINSQMPERIDTLFRTTIFAPISGRVMNVLVTTEDGGVIAPGEPILDIVQDDVELVVDARVRPQDIDNVHVGMKARVVLTAFNQRYLPQLFGEVRSLSADRLVDERTGQPYFLAKISVVPEEIEALGKDMDLVSGMPAEVMIISGERTFIDLLVKPISDSVRRSFRDDN